jgi:hypothetical protein
MAWYAKQNGEWAEVLDPKTRSTTAWTPVKEGWVKYQGVWQRMYFRDVTAPGAPSIDVTELATGFLITVIATDPNNAARAQLIAKNVATGFIETLTSAFDPLVGSVDFSWAEDPTPGTTYQFQATLYTNVDIPSVTNTEIYLVPPAANYYQRYFSPVSTDSWIRLAEGNSEWDADSNDIQQGGENLHDGYFFYGTRLNEIRGLTVTKMEIQIGRRNTVHGVNGAANVRLGHHGETDKPNTPSGVLDAEKVGELSRGQMKWFTVPESWYKAFKNSNNNYRGFGVTTDDKGSNSPNYFRSFSAADDVGNGRLYVEYHD